MLKAQIHELLNKKLNDEFYRSNLFLEISGWASDLSLKGVQGYFLNLSQKAYANVLSLMDYVNKCGQEVTLEEIREGVRDFDTIEDAFIFVKELEQGYKADLNNLLDTCLSEKDFATFATLESQVSTQHSEEFFLQSLLDKVQILGTKGQGLYLIDKELETAFPVVAETAE